jgi:hypothetical protein
VSWSVLFQLQYHSNSFVSGTTNCIMQLVIHHLQEIESCKICQRMWYLLLSQSMNTGHELCSDPDRTCFVISVCVCDFTYQIRRVCVCSVGITWNRCLYKRFVIYHPENSSVDISSLQNRSSYVTIAFNNDIRNRFFCSADHFKLSTLNFLFTFMITL